MFDIKQFQNLDSIQGGQYERRLRKLETLNIQSSCIKDAVDEAIKNIREHNTRSFVIYGEPQSGKTEMMIALTARLLDEKFQIIVHLLNDNVSLLDQNLKRFKSSGLAPAPVNFKEIIDRSVVIDERPFVIFCKKNPNDLNKLIDKVGKKNGIVVVDDEADYASPNAKINQGKRSKINELIRTLLGGAGIYIGVTATPARLDLNNTFENEHEKWVSFRPHDQYTGEKKFFPLSGKHEYEIKLISDGAGDNPKHCREAFFRFLVNSAYLNLHTDIVGRDRTNFTFLIHTSGKKIDHKKDFEEVQKIFAVLGNRQDVHFGRYVEQIWEIAKTRYPDECDQVTHFIVDNILRSEIKVLNSDNDVLNKGTQPSCPFSVIIGGNIISRGVTFDNLLSMFFTRDVKHKLQQDTYIQRARMFGSRGQYLKFFELTIPENLYADWHKCFVFHRLALKSIEAGNGAPVWLSNSRIAAVASGSIDKTNVSLDSGEMSYSIFDYEKDKEQIAAINNAQKGSLEKLRDLQRLLGEKYFPTYLVDFIEADSASNGSKIMIHDPMSIAGSKDAEQSSITRKKGLMGGAAYTKNPDVSHHIRIHFNEMGLGRVFYKYVAGITFIKNLKQSKSGGHD